MLRAFVLYLGGPGYEYHFGDRPLVFFVGFLSHRRYLPRLPEGGIAAGFQVVTKSTCAVNLTFDTVSHMQLKSVLI